MSQDQQDTRPGRLYPAQSLLLLEYVGTAEDNSGIAYELSVSGANRHMVVRSTVSGRYFALQWKDILQMAIQRGINLNDQPT